MDTFIVELWYLRKSEYFDKKVQSKVFHFTGTEFV